MIPRVAPGLPVLMVLGDQLRKAHAARNGQRSTETDGMGRDTARWTPLPAHQVPMVGSDLDGYVWTPPRSPRGAIDRPSLGEVARPRGSIPGRHAA